MVRWLPFIIELGLLVYCLVDAIQAEEHTVRNMPKWAWILLILFIPIAGPIAWLVAGKPLVRRAPAGPQAPLGPDDDPRFLEDLRRERERRERLELWEDDLKRREQQLRRTEDDEQS